MERVMIRLLNMSFAAGCTVLLVLVLRLFLRRLPKKYSYGLWWIVLFRFLCPVMIPSPFSLFPVNPEPMRPEIIYQAAPKIETGVMWVDRAVNHAVEGSLEVQNPAASVNPIQVWLVIGFGVWAIVLFLLAGYYFFQWILLKKKLSLAVKVADLETGILQVRESNQIDGAFVLGVVRPVVYLPTGLSREDRAYIWCHEKVHMIRRDYLVKLLGIFMVTVHWFNPLAWAGFRAMCMDMEMSCDERVLEELGKNSKKAYSQALLAEAEKRSGLLVLAFGKNDTYRRIRNILSYHKPKVLYTIGALALLMVAAAGLVTSPVKKRQSEEQKGAVSVSILGGADGPTSIFVAGKLGTGEEMPEPGSESDLSQLVSKEVRGWAEQGEAKEETGSQVYLDLASRYGVIFHGDFGLFSFERQENGIWKQQAYIEDADAGEQLALVLGQILSNKESAEYQEILDKEEYWTENGLGEDGRGLLKPGDNVICHMVKTKDGGIGILGAEVSGSQRVQLMDLYYGYYNPKEQVLTQVFLFHGDGREIRIVQSSQ